MDVALVPFPSGNRDALRYGRSQFRFNVSSVLSIRLAIIVQAAVSSTGATSRGGDSPICTTCRALSGSALVKLLLSCQTWPVRCRDLLGCRSASEHSAIQEGDSVFRRTRPLRKRYVRPAPARPPCAGHRSSAATLAAACCFVLAIVQTCSRLGPSKFDMNGGGAVRFRKTYRLRR